MSLGPQNVRHFIISCSRISHSNLSVSKLNFNFEHLCPPLSRYCKFHLSFYENFYCFLILLYNLLLFYLSFRAPISNIKPQGLSGLHQTPNQTIPFWYFPALLLTLSFTDSHPTYLIPVLVDLQSIVNYHARISPDDLPLLKRTIIQIEWNNLSPHPVSPKIY